MEHDDSLPRRMRWAQLRFSIIGPLLAAPPQSGELQERLLELAEKIYLHPTTKLTLRFGASTIERWYYQAKDQPDPVLALARKVPSHAGIRWAISPIVAQALATLYRQHPSWTMQLVYDNLLALAKQDPAFDPLPSYPTVRRYMKDQGMLRQRKRRRHRNKADSEETMVVQRETRSFEVSHVHALWHLDFHQGSRKVLLSDGQWRTPFLLGVLDDHSRLCCHLQWYLDETAEVLIHGLSQAILKRGLPRALLTDNGAAMLAAESTEGLARLGILHTTTLPYSPEQNAKQENFWARVEGRLIAMLEGEAELSLSLLNEATQAWVEQEYHRTHHGEIGATPLERALTNPTVVRPSPSSETLKRAFRYQTSRAVRRSDGTLTVEGVRFEVPWTYRTLLRAQVRVARWDLSSVDLVDPKTGAHLSTLLPLDKHKNADAKRRAIVDAPALLPSTPSGIAPRLRELMTEYAATGLPPAYLPKDDLADITTDEETQS